MPSGSAMPGRPRRAPRSSSTDWKPRTSRSGSTTGQRMASRGGVGLGDRPVEQARGVVALEVGGVGQHQVGVGDHLGGVGVGVDDVRDAVVAVGVLGGRACPWSRRCSSPSSRPCWPCRGTAPRSGTGRPPRRWGSPCASCRGRRAGLPRRRRRRCASARPSASTARSSGPRGKPSGGPSSGLPGVTLWCGLGWTRHGLGVGRLEAEAARRLDRAEQQLQQVQRAAGLEAVGVRGDAAHGVHGHRPAGHRGVALAAEVGPRGGRG